MTDQRLAPDERGLPFRGEWDLMTVEQRLQYLRRHDELGILNGWLDCTTYDEFASVLERVKGRGSSDGAAFLEVIGRARHGQDLSAGGEGKTQLSPEEGQRFAAEELSGRRERMPLPRLGRQGGRCALDRPGR